MPARLTIHARCDYCTAELEVAADGWEVRLPLPWFRIRDRHGEFPLPVGAVFCSTSCARAMLMRNGTRGTTYQLLDLPNGERVIAQGTAPPVRRSWLDGWHGH